MRRRMQHGVLIKWHSILRPELNATLRRSAGVPLTNCYLSHPPQLCQRYVMTLPESVIGVIRHQTVLCRFCPACVFFSHNSGFFFFFFDENSRDHSTFACIEKRENFRLNFNSSESGYRKIVTVIYLSLEHDRETLKRTSDQTLIGRSSESKCRKGLQLFIFGTCLSKHQHFIQFCERC